MIVKKFLWILCILFICGIISADICINELAYSKALLDIKIYQDYANAKLVFKDVFCSVLYERIKQMVLLIILCFTPIKERVAYLLVSVLAFLWGFFFMSCVSGLGFVGVVISIVAVLPHGILYGGVLLLLIQKNRQHAYYYRNRMMESSITYIAMIILFITACIIEGVMGTHFIPWVIRIGMV